MQLAESSFSVIDHWQAIRPDISFSTIFLWLLQLHFFPWNVYNTLPWQEFIYTYKAKIKKRWTFSTGKKWYDEVHQHSCRGCYTACETGQFMTDQGNRKDLIEGTEGLAAPSCNRGLLLKWFRELYILTYGRPRPPALLINWSMRTW